MVIEDLVRAGYCAASCERKDSQEEVNVLRNLGVKVNTCDVIAAMQIQSSVTFMVRDELQRRAGKQPPSSGLQNQECPKSRPSDSDEAPLQPSYWGRGHRNGIPVDLVSIPLPSWIAHC